MATQEKIKLPLKNKNRPLKSVFMSDKKALGYYGENLALKYYQKLHYKLITKNYYSRCGELDLVLEKNKQITVVEVKTRSTNKFLWAEESIDNKKIEKIRRTYEVLARQKKLSRFFELEALIIQITGSRATIRRYQL